MRESGRTKAMLCELLIVALFLALSSATLLQLFAAADSASRESVALTRAAMLAQDTLERLCAGEELEARQERVVAGEAYTVAVDVQTQNADGGDLYTYTVTVECEGEEVTRMQTACYRPEGSEP